MSVDQRIAMYVALILVISCATIFHIGITAFIGGWVLIGGCLALFSGLAGSGFCVYFIGMMGIISGLMLMFKGAMT